MIDTIAAELKAGKSEVVCEQTQLIKVSKDKDGVLTRTILTREWTDWVDYWAVDFDYESRKEIIQRPVNCGTEATPGLVDPSEFVTSRTTGPGATSSRMSGRASAPGRTVRRR